MGEDALPDPYLCLRDAPYQASLKPEFLLEHTYRSSNTCAQWRLGHEDDSIILGGVIMAINEDSVALEKIRDWRKEA